jgi:hypothetical protein
MHAPFKGFGASFLAGAVFARGTMLVIRRADSYTETARRLTDGLSGTN